jgi:hypothetical protein
MVHGAWWEVGGDAGHSRADRGSQPRTECDGAREEGNVCSAVQCSAVQCSAVQCRAPRRAGRLLWQLKTNETVFPFVSVRTSAVQT